MRYSTHVCQGITLNPPPVTTHSNTTSSKKVSSLPNKSYIYVTLVPFHRKNQNPIPRSAIRNHIKYFTFRSLTSCFHFSQLFHPLFSNIYRYFADDCEQYFFTKNSPNLHFHFYLLLPPSPSSSK